MNLSITLADLPLKGLNSVPLLPLSEAIQFGQERDEEFSQHNYDSNLKEAAMHIQGMKDQEGNSDLQGLSDEEAMAINLFAQESPFYPILNARMKKGKKADLMPFLPVIKLLMSGLYKLPLIQGKVFRAITNAKISKAPGLRKGKPCIVWSFATTATSKTVYDFLERNPAAEKTLLELHISTGVSIQPFSPFGEKEILLLPGTCFFVTSLQDHPRGFEVLEMKEVYVPSLTDLPRPSTFFPLSLPLRDHSFSSREAVLAQLESKLSTNPSRMYGQICLVGEAGTGKSSLALEFIYRAYERYEMIIWIPCETHPLSPVKQLALSLGLCDPNLPAEKAAKVVMRHLEEERSSWMLVYDDAASPRDLEGLLPDPGRAKGHVIITSRSSEWPEENVFLLPSLSAMEGMELLLHCSGKRSGSELKEKGKDKEEKGEDDEGGQVVKDLGNLPLSLKLSGCFLKETKMSFSSYLEKIQKAKKELEGNEPKEIKGRETDALKGLTIAVVITMENLQKKFPESLPLLYRSLLVAPTDIPQGVFTRQGKSTVAAPENWIPLISPLLSYGILSETKLGYFSVHRFVQSVMKSSLGGEQGTKILKELGPILALEWEFDERNPSTWKGSIQFVPHLEAFLAHEPCDQSLPPLLCRLGNFHKLVGANPLKALDWYSRSLEMAQRVHGRKHPNIAMAMSSLGLIYCDLKDYPNAIHHLSGSLRMYQALHGDEHPAIASSLYDLGIVYLEQGDLPKAIESLDGALDAFRSVFDNEHPRVAQCLVKLGNALGEMEEFPKALEYLHQSLEIFQIVHEGDHPDTAQALDALGSTYFRMGDQTNAIEFLTQSVEMRKRLEENEHPEVGTCLNRLGILFDHQEDYDLSLHSLNQAYQIFLRAFGPDHPSTDGALKDLLRVQEKVNGTKKD